MEKKDKSFKLIYMILIGCIITITCIIFVTFNNYNNNMDNNIEKTIISNQKSEAYSIKQVNSEYFAQEIEVPQEPIITNLYETKNQLTFKEAKIDNDFLLIKLEVSTKNEKVKNYNNLIGFVSTNLEIGPNIYNINKGYENIFEIIKLDNDLFEIYIAHDVRGLNFDKNIKLTSNIHLGEDNYDRTIGVWKLELAITEDIETNFNEKYHTNDLIIESKDGNSYSNEYCEIVGVRVLENNIILNALLNNYVTEEGVLYGLKVFDQNNNSLTYTDKIRFVGGAYQDILLKKFNLNSEINISLIAFEMESGKILSEIQDTIKLSNYLQEITETEPQPIMAYADGLEFSINTPQWRVSEKFAYETIDYNNLEYYIHLIRTGQKNGFDVDYLDIYIDKYENEFNESLEEMYYTRKKLSDLGVEEKRQTEYSIYLESEPESTEISFSFEEIMDIYDGKKVIKNQKEYDKEIIQKIKGTTDSSYSDFYKLKIDGQEAITYYENTENARRIILITVNDYIYEITFNDNLALEDEIYEILNSMSIK